jgi:hypothetical protein
MQQTKNNKGVPATGALALSGTDRGRVERVFSFLKPSLNLSPSLSNRFIEPLERGDSSDTPQKDLIELRPRRSTIEGNEDF